MPDDDLLIRGGRVLAAASGLDGALDVALSAGRVFRVAAGGPAGIPAGGAGHVVEAAGCLVVPGLIDLHTHLGFKLHGQVVDPDEVCPPAGVTTAVDMGTTGAFTFPWYADRVLPHTTTRLLAFLNIASLGTLGAHSPYYVERYGQYIDVDDTVRTIAERREWIRGIKVFAASALTGRWPVEALRAARRVADRVSLPIAVHVSDEEPPLEDILPLLGAGDIMTHTYTGHAQRIWMAPGGCATWCAMPVPAGCSLTSGMATVPFSGRSRGEPRPGLSARHHQHRPLLPEPRAPGKGPPHHDEQDAVPGDALRGGLGPRHGGPARALREEDLGALGGGPADLASCASFPESSIRRFCAGKRSPAPTPSNARPPSAAAVSSTNRGFMKAPIITDVERIWVEVPLKVRHDRHLTRENWDWTVFEILRLHTDCDLVGYGETMCYYTWGRVPDEQVERVKGHSPFEFLWDDALGAGLQMAVYDLAGKALGVPCYRLLGPKVHQWCLISWWTNDMSTEDWLAEVREALELGYLSAKLKARPWRDFRAQIEALAAVVPSDFRFDADFNAFLRDAAAAVPYLLALEQVPSISFFESPIPQGDVEGNNVIRGKITRPIAMHYGSPPIDAMAGGCVTGLSSGRGAPASRGEFAAQLNKPFWLQMVGASLTTAWMLHQGPAHQPPGGHFLPRDLWTT